MARRNTQLLAQSGAPCRVTKLSRASGQPVHGEEVTKVWLHKHGHILSAFEFQKVWDHQAVIQHIRDGFGERIPEDVSLEFLMACGNKLVCPKLQKGQELNGVLIHKVYKTKALYVKPSRMLLEILLELASKINMNQRCRVNINRSAVWEGAVRGFKRLSYEPHLMVSVKFSDDMGESEEGVDLGGPRREFLRLLIESIAKSPMFEGKENSKNLALYSTALREDWYYIAGRAIAISLVHGGPPPNFLSLVLFSLLIDVPANPVPEDIADADLLEKVKKVSESTSIEDLEKAKAPLLDYLANAGCLRPLRSITDRDLLVQDIVMFQVIHRVQGPFQRFCEGLKILGVLEKIQKYPDSFRPLFCYEPSALTADQLDDLFTIHLSSEGSNKRVAEEVVIPFWRDYLQDAEEEGPSKLQKILAFATGASVVPPIGFSPSPSVEFIHKGDDDFSSTPLFPMANTCINCIKLPLHVSYQLLKEKFDFALGNTYGFGRA
ncbi:G2/M phase-specific E3 ubiquitin-protein ligase [Larimichthys crocea]|uniref:G2/M phase-specific E3 ubiquitin-protein ligase n=1 Tax=Larimichthys crocea TaxID=215358 RepID=UPI000F5F4991|nr:G2/M phase-specific E3 ubiquitin-protein ligase [Larimichthys crocea]